MNEIGVVIFKDINNYTEGVAYSRSHLLRKVNSLKELDDNIIWISNIPAENILPDYIKPNNYFGLTVDSIIYRLGINYEKVAFIVKELFYLFERVIEKAQKNYPIKIESKSLASDLSKILKFKNYNFNDKNIVKKFSNLNQAEITPVFSDDNKKVMYLTAARYGYIKNLCKTEIPVGEWISLSKKEINDRCEKNKQWFFDIASKYHFIASVKINVNDKSLKKILPEHYTKGKVWITNSEYVFFSSFCEMYIDNLIISKNKIYLEEIESTRLFKINPMEDSFLSNYITAYNYIKSFQLENNILSKWIIMEDKLNMLKISYIFSKIGVDVLSYGDGSLVISYEPNRDELRKIIAVANKLNLNYPLELLSLV